MDLAMAGALVKAVLGVGLSLVGAIVLIVGALAVLRFPDVFSRAHALHAVDGVGGALFCIGLAIVAWDIALSPLLLLLAALSLAAAPMLAQIVVAAAHASGVSPKVGAAAKDSQGI